MDAMNGNTKRKARSSVAELPGSLPKATIPPLENLPELMTSAVATLASLGPDKLIEGALWRDSLALTGTFRTFYGAKSVSTVWSESSLLRSPSSFKLIPHSTHVSQYGEYGWVEAGFTFETTGKEPQATCSGFISLVPDPDGNWKIWLLRTILENLKGHGDVDQCQIKSGLTDDTRYGTDGSTRPESQTDFDCVIVGGGPSGLSLAGRLEALGVSYVLIDKYKKVGDNWNTRYDSLKLHTVREYAHLPFERTFGSDCPEYLPRQILADGYQRWMKKFGINVRTSTELRSLIWRENGDGWILKVQRDGHDETITARHVTFAVGHAQRPSMPDYPGQEHFKGVVMHSVDYKSSSQWKGKHGIVVGTANTGHDVAEDMLKAGLASVTMIQRDRTWILPVANVAKAQEPLYNAHMPTDLSDRLLFSNPMVVSRLLTQFFLHGAARSQAPYFEALEQTGFKVERYGDLQHVLYERFGGHYVDVGNVANISKGLVKAKSDSAIASYTTDGLKFEDGTELPADVVIFATGFKGDMRETVGRFAGPKVESQLEEFMGVNEEGEMLGVWKFSGHPNLWYMAGDLALGRYNSRFLALQIKADLIGKPLEPYTKTP